MFCYILKTIGMPVLQIFFRHSQNDKITSFRGFFFNNWTDLYLKNYDEQEEEKENVCLDLFLSFDK